MYHLLYNRTKKKYAEVLFHIAFWIIFIVGEVIVATSIVDGNRPILHYVLYYFLNISLVYFHIWWLLYYVGTRKTGIKLKYIVFVLLELFIYFFLAALISKILGHAPDKHFVKVCLHYKFLIPTLWRGIYFLLLATAYYLLKRNLLQQEIELKSELEIEKLKSKLLVSEKEFLRAQINPHLLFNTLTFIRSAARHNPEHAREAISCLADIMRYALQESKDGFVNLESEIEQINNMIQLNRLRFENHLNLEYATNIEDGNIKIIPIILLTLVENIFKHGNVLAPNCPAKITISSDASTIIFESCNLSDFTPPDDTDKLGLVNIRERLNASYPNRFTFTHSLHHNLFLVNLRINILV
ncbi:sensor histidine kinase [Pedobacter jeongneungensis]|uniref:sensor histidine kinase n=1 Tax=Pedobacter jeongneungensis TaxID=947309 RepID=UPI000468357B|nr:histidine kinase [Pedobacter jeongneungensis]